MKIQVGVVIGDAGAAIITAEQDDDGDALVTAIAALPFDVEAAAKGMAEVIVKHPDAQFVVDGSGIGEALWELVVEDEHLVRDELASREQGRDGAPLAWLYRAHGIERQALVNTLVVAIARQSLTFAGGLAQQEAMTAALVGYRREVKDDGDLGSALVTALCLALLPRLLPIRHQAFLA